MQRKMMALLLTLALLLSGTGSSFAQDVTPAAPNAEAAAQSVYLPLVQTNQQTTTVATDSPAADEVTVTEESADGGEVSGSGDRSKQCGNSRGGERWGNRHGALEVVGLTANQRLICFDEKNPRSFDAIGSISGLTTDTNLVGIDFRPATGELYGLGNAGGLYTLNLANAKATLRARLNVALSGSAFGVDFNPTVDRLRIISDDGQNLRVNVDDGITLVDGTLAYTPGTPAPGIAGAAYTNNDTDANTATTLYDLDATLDQVVIQSPANSGQLAATGKLTVDATTAIGFDIYSTVRDGTTEDVRALASLAVNGQTNFYRISLFTGKATAIGTFRTQHQVIGIAIPLNQR